MMLVLNNLFCRPKTGRSCFWTATKKKHFRTLEKLDKLTEIIHRVFPFCHYQWFYWGAGWLRKNPRSRSNHGVFAKFKMCVSLLSSKNRSPYLLRLRALRSSPRQTDYSICSAYPRVYHILSIPLQKYESEVGVVFVVVIVGRKLGSTRGRSR